MQKRQYWGLIITLAIGLAGCSTAPDREAGFEVDKGGQQTGQILPDSRTSKTVLALLDNARTAAQAGQLHTAEAQLERALRIEPRNAVLWHYMAKLRLHQDRVAEAAGLAAKSNSLAGDDEKLRADNWRIIAHARYQQGDRVGAKQAQEKVEQFKP